MEPKTDTFLRTVLRSGLLDREQLQAALRDVPREHRDDPQGLADHLIKQGKLSRFQAHKLLQGAAFGLMLGPYQVQAPIGRGGMGAVYLAIDSRSGQRVALKVLPPKLAREQEHYVARFRREMELSQRLIHPHIAMTYEAGVSQGVYYIAMEYIPGMSLYRLVNKEGPLEVARAARLFAEVAMALEHAHGQGLIHRDLKPSNIMVTPNDHAKVLDLGLALIEGEELEDKEVIGGRGYVVGSMDYIAPEQIEDATKVDGRADIYGLGCSLYFTLSGRPPFPGGSKRDKVRCHRYEEPPLLTELTPRVPAAFADLVARMMAKLVEKRPATAAQVRDLLLPWTTGQTVLPMDKESDPFFEQAVKTLETAEVSSDLLSAAILPKADETLPVEELVVKPTGEVEREEYWWIFLALGGFWLLVLLALCIMFVVR
jgi:serine/threonine protein kinase